MARSSTADPLEKFRFKVSFSTTSESSDMGRAGFLECGMPKRTTSKILYREGNDPDISTVSAGLSTMEDITLTRGLVIRGASQSSSVAGMYQWMSSVHSPGSTDAVDRTTGAVVTNLRSAVYRKDVTIEVLDRSGNTARTYVLHNAWPVSFAPGSDLNANEDGDKMIESITLAYEDFTETFNTAPVAPSPDAAAPTP